MDLILLVARKCQVYFLLTREINQNIMVTGPLSDTHAI